MPFGQEPECGHESEMFSGRTIHVIKPLHLGCPLEEKLCFTPSHSN